VLSDDIGPTSSGSGSSGPRRWWVRKKTLAAALAVTAATGVVGLTQATTANAANAANAATLGKVGIETSVANANNWGVGWGAAWSMCQYFFPGTKSVEFDHAEYPNPDRAVQVWKCRDTP
jgi:hypothetical protein